MVPFSPTMILTIIGVIATISLGVAVIIIVLKTKYPGKLTFIKEDCLSLFDDIAKIC